MGFPVAHRPKLHSTNQIERLNGEIKRRTEIIGIFPNEAGGSWWPTTVQACRRR
jgi:putative transposase